MALLPVENTPGLWRDPDWQPETPGLYALIVGISKYTHLQGGSAPANETYKLGGQLHVSARTAAAVFDWLRRDYQYKDLPVVWCYFLLSPSQGEEQFLKISNVKHYQNPTNSNLREAIQLWYSSLPTKRSPLDNSRTLFFFSGHGVHSNWDPLLLPSDYLYPPDLNPILERCVSTKEITEWMDTHPVAEHLALFDACRNNFSTLSEKGSTANRVLPVNPLGHRPRVAACLSATAPDTTAYQTKDEEFTFFGRAVIEGLTGLACKNTVGGATALDVEFKDLENYVCPRVEELLQGHNPSLEQKVESKLFPYGKKLIVTQAPKKVGLVSALSVRKPDVLVQKPVAKIFRELKQPLRSSKKINPFALLKSIHRHKTKDFPRTPDISLRTIPSIETESQLGTSPDERRKNAEKIQDSQYKISVEVDQTAFALRDFSTAHSYFGHEFASNLWGDFHLHALSDRGSFNNENLKVCQVTMVDSGTIMRVDTDLYPGQGGVLAQFGGMFSSMQAMPLPTELEDPVPIRFTLTFSEQILRRVEGQLGPSNRPHYDYLWKLSRIANFSSFADAANEADPEKLKEAVRDKVRGSVAAIAGAIILACGGQIRKVGDWTHNLMEFFPDIPDGAILWAESLRSAMADGDNRPFNISDPLGAMAEAIGALKDLGVPFFADTIELLNNQLRYLYGMHDSLSYEQLGRLDAIRRIMDKIFLVARPSGHFLLLNALPRPASFGKTDKPLEIEEMVKLLRPRQ